MQVNFIRDRLEIECAPITWCNLNCSFCENDTQRVHHDPSVLSRTINIIEERGSQYKKIDIGFWGGEVLADALDDNIILQYDHFIDDVYKICQNIGVPLTVDVCSNLIHHRVEWLLKWKRQHNITISTSYDFVERFDKLKHFQWYQANVEKIFSAGYNVIVNMVAVKPNIDFLYNNNNDHPLIQYMNYLYNRGAIFEVEYYNDVCGVPEMVVTPKQLAEFMVFLYHKYPRFTNFEHTLPIKLCDRNPEKISADFIAVYPINTRIYRYPIKHYNSSSLVLKIMKQKRCISCRYFGKCAPRHPIEYEDGNFCITKHIMENIGNGTN